jgi:hypothetical protein
VARGRESKKREEKDRGDVRADEERRGIARESKRREMGDKRQMLHL